MFCWQVCRTHAKVPAAENQVSFCWDASKAFPLKRLAQVPGVLASTHPEANYLLVLTVPH